MRFPIIQQHDSMQCGIACLQMICKYHGRTVSASKLDGICHATTEGVSLLGMNDAANVVFGAVLFIYNSFIFLVFLAGSIIYGIWIALFMRRRKVLDYELFEQQAINSNNTYQFITSMQEIKLQDCEQRRRWEWEDVQADLFKVQMKSLKLTQTQEAGSIFINELKNIIITVLSATAVIHGDLTLGMMQGDM